MYSSLTVHGRHVTVEGSDEWILKLQGLYYPQRTLRPVFQARGSLDCQRGLVHGSLEHPGKGPHGMETNAQFVQFSIPLYSLVEFFLSLGFHLVQCEETNDGKRRYHFIQNPNVT